MALQGKYKQVGIARTDQEVLLAEQEAEKVYKDTSSQRHCMLLGSLALF